MDVDQGSSGFQNSNGEASERVAPKRGSKREYGDAEEAEEVLESKRAREKRARKVSIEKSIPEEEMEIDEHDLEDGFADHGRFSRGKKRDREEAGSTFGGDDEDQSELEDPEEDAVTRRSRKRRSVARRQSSLATNARGKKRDRDIDDYPSDDGSDAYDQGSSRKRRNKKEGRLVESVDGDVSMDESPARGKGRKIGEEWTSNGVLFKIGPNCQRLRQALVKKARQKYNMPEDSQHPDRDANLEVYVETWLTEEEYQDAKAQHLLAWQDTPKASLERDAHSERVQPPPSPVGKSLLWKSTAPPPTLSPDGVSPTLESPSTGTPTTKGRVSFDSRRQSFAVDVAMSVNPFQQYPVQPRKRIASAPTRASSAGPPGLVDTTNSSPRGGHRIYSKWEKQDLEANAMMKMREATRKKEAQEKERHERERLEKERVEREKAEKEKPAPTVPIITITTPAEDKPAESKVPNFFPKPSEPAQDAAKPPTTAASPFTLPNSFAKPVEKMAQPAENKPLVFPTAAPAADPFTFSKPGPTPFMPVDKPAESSTKAADQPRPSPFGLPQPTAATAAPSGVASIFSFQKPAVVSEQKKPEQSGQGQAGTSLLSRLGGAAPDTKAAAPAQQLFSFPKASEAPKPFFSGPTTTVQGPSAPSSSDTSLTSTMPSNGPAKFDFKFQKRSTATTTAPGTAAPDSSKPTASAPNFSFKPLSMQGAENNTVVGLSATTDGNAVPKFSFGVPSSAPGNYTASQALKNASNVGGDSGLGSKSTFPFGVTGTSGDSSAKPAFGHPSLSGTAAQPVLTGFSSAGASADSGKSSFAGFANLNTNSALSNGPNITGDSRATGFSAFGNANVPGTSNALKPPIFAPLGSGPSTATGGSGASEVKAAEPPKVFTFGQTLGATTPTPATATAPVFDASKTTLNSGVLNAAKDSTSTSAASGPLPKPSFGLSNPLTKAGALGGATNAFPSTTNQSTPNTLTMNPIFKFGPSTPFGAGGSGPSVFGSMQGMTPPTFGVPAGGQTAATTSTTFASPALSSGFGSNSNPTLPASAPSSGASAFGNAPSSKPGNLFGTSLVAQSAFGNTSASTNNSSSAMDTTANSTGGQS
jgi:hypothetical protein